MSKNGNLTAAQVLFPIGLLSLVIFLATAFQTTQVFQARAVLHQAKASQEKPIEDARRLQAQLDALAVGTLKLAQKGDKNAQGIIDQLKKLGITVAAPKAETTGSAGPRATPEHEHIAMPSKP
jgi:hypothetical protein